MDPCRSARQKDGRPSPSANHTSDCNAIQHARSFKPPDVPRDWKLGPRPDVPDRLPSTVGTAAIFSHVFFSLDLRSSWIHIVRILKVEAILGQHTQGGSSVEDVSPQSLVFSPSILHWHRSLDTAVAWGTAAHSPLDAILHVIEPLFNPCSSYVPTHARLVLDACSTKDGRMPGPHACVSSTKRAVITIHNAWLRAHLAAASAKVPPPNLARPGSIGSSNFEGS